MKCCNKQGPDKSVVFRGEHPFVVYGQKSCKKVPVHHDLLDARKISDKFTNQEPMKAKLITALRHQSRFRCSSVVSSGSTDVSSTRALYCSSLVSSWYASDVDDNIGPCSWAKSLVILAKLVFVSPSRLPAWLSRQIGTVGYQKVSLSWGDKVGARCTLLLASGRVLSRHQWDLYILCEFYDCGRGVDDKPV